MVMRSRFPSRLLFGPPLFLLAFTSALFVQHAGAASSTSGSVQLVSRGRGGVHGPTICVDPAFPYYKQHSWAETCQRIHDVGFTAVQVVDTGTSAVPTQLLAEVAQHSRNAGLSPVLRVYPPTHFALYYAHPEWRQRMLGGADGKFDWRVYQCMNQPGFVDAYCRAVTQQLQAVRWDGVQFAELWLEQWGGPDDNGKSHAAYACVCDECVRLFQARTGVDAREMLTSTTSATYFKNARNAALYKQWVDFRVDTVTSFGAALASAVRQVDPHLPIDVMSLSDARVEPGKAREYQAIDLERIVQTIHPASVTIEDAWQDWTRAELSPDFVREYASYVPQLHALDPKLVVFSHADIGSVSASRRSPAWINSFATESLRAGFDAPSFYEWSISRLAK